MNDHAFKSEQNHHELSENLVKTAVSITRGWLTNLLVQELLWDGWEVWCVGNDWLRGR